MGKADSTGNYFYTCDGMTPGSPVLSDGHTLYTPGLSENKGGASRYYSNDRLGNLWTVDGASKSQAYYLDTTGFGATLAASGSGTVFGFGGGNGCQTDADVGIILMGHRYYDPRTGRFLSQDPIGDGDNWYAYCDNNPVDSTDPTGLSTPPYNNLSAGNGSSGEFMTIGDPAGMLALDQAFAEANHYPTLYGYWSNGAPTGYLPNGQPTVSAGEIPTNWMPIPDTMGGAIAGIPPYHTAPQQEPPWWMQALHDLYQGATHPISPIPGIGPVRGPDGRFVRDPNATRSPEFDPKKARRIWERAKGRSWPKDPTTGQNFDVHHIKMKSQGGSLYNPENITPVHPDMHDQLHRPGGPY